MVLEEETIARKRKADIYAEFKGWGQASDGYHVALSHPEGNGLIQSMKRALESVKLGLKDIDYINAHGTSTQINDVSETMAIKAIFGDHAYRVPISSTKSMIGHALGGSGALEAVVSIKTVLEGEIHPTINYEYPDPDCDLDYVPNVARRQDVRAVLSNSFGFGGQNACLVFKAYQG